MNFVKLTEKNGEIQWVNLDLIITIDTDMAASGMTKGSRLIEVGENPGIYIARETPEEILQLAEKSRFKPITICLPDGAKLKPSHD